MFKSRDGWQSKRGIWSSEWGNIECRLYLHPVEIQAGAQSSRPITDLQLKLTFVLNITIMCRYRESLPVDVIWDFAASSSIEVHDGQLFLSRRWCKTFSFHVLFFCFFQHLIEVLLVAELQQKTAQLRFPLGDSNTGRLSLELLNIRRNLIRVEQQQQHVCFFSLSL